MEFEVYKNVIVNAKDEDEEFGLINFSNHFITFNPSKQDDYIFRDPEDESILNSGQIHLNIETGSLQEYLEILAFFIKNNWVNEIIIKDNFTWNERTSYIKSLSHHKKELFTVRKIEELCNDEDKGPAYLTGYYSFCLRLDKRRLNNFREMMKNIPGYKVIWVDQDISGGFKNLKRYIY